MLVSPANSPTFSRFHRGIPLHLFREHLSRNQRQLWYSVSPTVPRGDLPQMQTRTCSADMTPSGETSKEQVRTSSFVSTRPVDAVRRDSEGTNALAALRNPHIAVIVVLVRAQTSADTIRLERVQEMRKEHDQAYERWAPHLTLIPPFTIPFVRESASDRENETNAQEKERGVQFERLGEANIDPGAELDHAADGSGAPQANPDATTEPRQNLSALEADLDDISKRISSICDSHASFTLPLGDVGSFKLSRYTTIHLRPRPPARSSERASDERDVGSAHHSSETSEEPKDPRSRLARIQHELELALPEAAKSPRGGSNRGRGRGNGRGRSRGGGRGGGNGPGQPERVENAENDDRPGEAPAEPSVLPTAEADSSSKPVPKPERLQPFSPHLTLGQSFSSKQKADLLSRAWELCAPPDPPLNCFVDKIQLMVKPQSRMGPYDIWKEFELAGNRESVG